MILIAFIIQGRFEMDLQQYQMIAKQEANPDLTRQEALSNWSLGLLTKADLVEQHVKEHLSSGAPLSPNLLMDLLGELIWNYVRLVEELKLSAHHILIRNLATLHAQCSENYFSHQREQIGAFELALPNLDNDSVGTTQSKCLLWQTAPEQLTSTNPLKEDSLPL